jgi:ATP-dependent RNA helicase DHX37/DHR1
MPRFVPRQRKHKARQRKAAQNDDGNVNSNQIQILPLSKEEREEKRRKLKQELRAGQPNISSKKQKRLDKYIETKLKKDENLDLLKRLSRGKFDTSQLQSSKDLGKRKHAQFAADGGLWKNTPTHGHKRQSGSEVESDLESADSFELQHEQSFKGRLENGHHSWDAHPKPVVTQGSGLRQPLPVDSNGLPVIHTKKKQAKRKRVTEESWEGFDPDSDNEKLALENFGDVQSDDSVASYDSHTDEDSTDDDEASSTDSYEHGSESSQDDDHQRGKSRIAPRTSAFKSWATQQINDSLGYVPLKAEDYTEASKHALATTETIVTEPAPDSDIAEDGPKSTLGRKVYNVPVIRTTEIEESRAKLPIVAEEQKIMETIHNNQCVIIWGTTGSGKTTQVPQFLFEAGYGSPESSSPGMIGITQPRRVAAVSMAKRVGEELGQHGGKVSYQIRFESTTSKDTAVKFMTDGILLREIAHDFALMAYSVIIIDEAHERSVNTDILIGMLSRIVDLRRKMTSEDSSVKPLKLVIMSATLRVSDFLKNSNLFPSALPLLVQAEGRQFPVTRHFARRTERDYLEEAFRKISRGHRKLPPGGMLVFLTGQNEIKCLLKRLEDTFRSSNRSVSGSMKVQLSASEGPLEADDLDLGVEENMEIEGGDEDEDSDIDFLGHDDEDQDIDFDIGEPVTTSLSVHLLALYSQLPTKEQLRVFEIPPEGSRLIVLATNVAETSLTIPGIRYVFDCGRSKERVYDQSTGVQKFEVNWISKASAEQRAGRAGRTGPGHCYRLYSSAVYERDFVEHADPEILRTPIESVVLQMKTMGLDNVVNFPFPTAPERSSLVKAERLLKNLGALTSTGRITQLGHSLSIYPLSPRYGKMLAIGSEHGCLPYVIALVSGLTEGDVFVPENQLDLNPKDHKEDEIYTNEDRLEDTAREQRRNDYNKARATLGKHDPTSDALRLLSAVCAYAYADNGDSFCKEMFLHPRALKEISQLRKQLTNIVQANHPQCLGTYVPRLPSPSARQLKALNQIVSAGFIDQLAIRADLSPNPPVLSLGKPKRAIDVPYLALSTPYLPPTTGAGAGTARIDAQAIYIHPSSILASLPPRSLPQYVVYSHLQQSAPLLIIAPENQQKQRKIRMFPITAVSATQLSALTHDTPLVSYGKPIGKIASLGGVPERREAWVVPFLRAGSEGGGVGWPLPARKVVQRRDGKVGAGWVVEKFLS